MLFSTLFPNVRDNTGHLTSAREVLSNGCAGAAAAFFARAAGATAFALNPVAGFVYCSLATIVDKTVGDIIRGTFQKTLLPVGSNDPFINLVYSAARITNVKVEIKNSVLRASDALAKVTTIMLTTFAIGAIIPSLSVSATTGLMTCVAALTLNAVFDASLAKFKGL